MATLLSRLPIRLGGQIRTSRLLSSISSTETNHAGKHHSRKSKQNDVPERLMQIADPVLDLAEKHGYTTIADIGADHGMLSCYLASKKQIRQVMAIDNSALTIQLCTENVVKGGLTDKVAITLGDGLTPLLNDRKTTDAVIIAGVGSSSVVSILSGRSVGCSKSSLSDLGDDFVDSIRKNTDSLQLKCLAIQPWPSWIVHQLQLSSLLLHSGWSFAHQSVCASSRSNMQLTTIFTNSCPRWCGDRRLDLDEVFNLMPLFQKLDDTDASHRLTKAFLQKQYEGLTVQIMRGKTFSFNDLQNRISEAQSAAGVNDREDRQVCKLIVSLQQTLGIHS